MIVWKNSDGVIVRTGEWSVDEMDEDPSAYISEDVEPDPGQPLGNAIVWRNSTAGVENIGRWADRAGSDGVGGYVARPRPEGGSWSVEPVRWRADGGIEVVP